MDKHTTASLMELNGNTGNASPAGVLFVLHEAISFSGLNPSLFTEFLQLNTIANFAAIARICLSHITREHRFYNILIHISDISPPPNTNLTSHKKPDVESEDSEKTEESDSDSESDTYHDYDYDSYSATFCDTYDPNDEYDAQNYYRYALRQTKTLLPGKW